ncbi:site-specific integrase [Mycobacterium sp. SMC-2]|uniref:tyrosine-type recombinase/integrase n=1 Tax=Mycobacterium sp. SMC-2 TaxID=2857058 RepID=UPI0021B2BC23|nr:site-specific integrase [Mycobacterium sp. SMC-2]UXA04434.1 site-specific integrase [Mycobacterium sp. SMC-2]
MSAALRVAAAAYSPALVAELPDRVIEWQTWQYAQSLSARTVAERTATVMRCAQWVGADHPETLRTDQITRWLAHGGDWSLRTRWTYHASLVAWFSWLEEQEYRVPNPMDKVGKPRRPRSEPRPISDSEMRRLLRLRLHRRTRAMVLLAALQGLRAHEIAKVKGEHLDLVDRTLVVTGKGGVTATLPLHHLVVEHAYRMPRRGWWFPGADRGHQRRESVCGTVKEAMIRAGISGSAHQLRHWFGTALVKAGVDLRTVQTLMRHQNLTSTAIYTAVADEQRAKGIQLLDPFGVAPAAQRDPAKSAAQPEVTVDELRRQAAELLAAAEKLESAQ